MIHYATVKKISGIVLVFFTATACSDFLAEDPKGFIPVEQYYNTREDAIEAVNSIYAYLNATNTAPFAGVYHSTFWVAAGLAADELSNQQAGAPALDQLASFTYGPQNGALLEIWRMHYKTLMVANVAIEKIPDIEMDESLKARLLGEARFLRGLLYFNLVRMFGSVPMPLLEEDHLDMEPEPVPVESIYAQVIEDLTIAEESLPESYSAGGGRGRATLGAAKSVLAKVYLTLEDWEQCAAKAMEVINSGTYDLHQDYADIFKLENRSGQEAIFSVGFGFAGGAIIFWEDGQLNIRLLPQALTRQIPGVNAQGWQVPVQPLYDSFDEGDRRREVTFLTEITDNEDGSVIPVRPYIQKYWDRTAEPNAGGTENDFPVIRYADVLLMYAEAANELGNLQQAHEYINKVRERARFDGSAYRDVLPDYENLSGEAFREAVLEERRKELVCEGHRWFDLARTGKLEELVPLAKPGVRPAGKHYLFPIPLEELDLNPNLQQNEGY